MMNLIPFPDSSVRYTYYCETHRDRTTLGLAPSLAHGAAPSCPVCSEPMFYVPNGDVKVPTANAPALPSAPTAVDPCDRNATIIAIRHALKARSGKSWSVTGGTGTAYGWITIDVPPARRRWRYVDTGQRDGAGYPIYREEEGPTANGHGSPAERAELAALLGLPEAVHHQGVQIAASNDYRREYLARARGETPAVIGTPYWD